MKKIIFIGKTGSGKTTLCQKLHDMRLKYRKTQSIEVYDNAIDTPGEYIENRHFYKALMVSSVDAKLIAVLVDPTSGESFIPPGFATMFAKEVIGIITKISLAKEKDIESATATLRRASIHKIFKVDTLDNIGIDELFAYIDS